MVYRIFEKLQIYRLIVERENAQTFLKCSNCQRNYNITVKLIAYIGSIGHGFQLRADKDPDIFKGIEPCHSFS